MSKINPDYLASFFRNKIINLHENKILLTMFSNTEQGSDVTSGINCGGYGRLHRYNRPSTNWPSIRVPEEPAAWRLGLHTSQVQVAQIFQIAACDFRCWYCFVDKPSLSATQKSAKFYSCEEMLALYLKEKNPTYILSLSGGQPDIAPEWTVWMMKALEKMKLKENIYLWQDDNLSCGNTWKHLSDEEREYIKFYKNYGRCCCLKSFTPQGFSETTGVGPQYFDRQFELLKKLQLWGIDIYIYITLTSSTLDDLSLNISHFFDKLQSEIHPNIPLRIVPIEIKIFTPTLGRINNKNQNVIDNQYFVLQAWNEELYKRFPSCEIEKPIYQVNLI